MAEASLASEGSSVDAVETPSSKMCQAYQMICADPKGWFRDAIIDDRDRALLTGPRASFAEYSKKSYVRKIYHMKAGEGFKQTEWKVETDVACKKLIRSAGGHLYGFDFTEPPSVHWASATVNVNIQGASDAGFDWGFLSTRPSNIRIFKGPPETCIAHPWDAMILKDTTPNTDGRGFSGVVGGRRWDILAMKMCEDYDSPWLVTSVVDAGPAHPDHP